MQKKIKKFGVIEYIYEYFLELVECKLARNGWSNLKTFFTLILKNNTLFDNFLLVNRIKLWRTL